MNWGSEEEKRKFAIGAIFGSEFYGLSGVSKNASSGGGGLFTGGVLGFKCTVIEPIITTYEAPPANMMLPVMQNDILEEGEMLDGSIRTSDI